MTTCTRHSDFISAIIIENDLFLDYTRDGVTQWDTILDILSENFPEVMASVNSQSVGHAVDTTKLYYDRKERGLFGS